MKAADDDDMPLWPLSVTSLTFSGRITVVSALGWVFDEDELDPLPGCG